LRGYYSRLPFFSSVTKGALPGLTGAVVDATIGANCYRLTVLNMQWLKINLSAHHQGIGRRLLHAIGMPLLSTALVATLFLLYA
jgi:hypothetical protein